MTQYFTVTIDLQLDLVSLIITLWAWTLSQFSTHTTDYSSRPTLKLVYKNFVGDSDKGLTEGLYAISSVLISSIKPVIYCRSL